MSSAIDRNNTSDNQYHPQSRDRRTHRRGFHRGVLVWVVVGLLLVAAVPTAFYVFAHVAPGPSGSGASATPADRFMQSIVSGDGSLGWHQLCPTIQSQLPLHALEQQATAQHKAMAQQGMWLTSTPVGTHSQPDGGVAHVYVVTAHWHSGVTQSTTFTVSTQRSGCVEDVQN
jgi:hypothetical protein